MESDLFNLGGFNFEDRRGHGRTLSSRVTAFLLEKVRTGGLAPGARLPTENVMAQRFGVSRTVIREAIAALKNEGLIETRQGSGAYVRRAGAKPAFNVDTIAFGSVHQLLGMIEVRRAIDSEMAALAAVRRNGQQIEDIRRAMAAIDEAVAAGGNGVHEDVQFHITIALATGNPHWVKLVEMFAAQLVAAVSITRANEARRNDFAAAVRLEHQRIVDAIIAGNPTNARAAAGEHMEHASERVVTADQEFWALEGKRQNHLATSERIPESA